MPIFEYKCEECGAVSEILVRHDTKLECEQCASTKLDKLISAPAGHVKSGGLPMASSCPPPQAGPCGPGCCRM
ncbi:Zinc ribbon domain protein [Polystyrenella longa]|uniref:Zinc ribbon domain protein n=1 Tax=Polystyrenella longa TaxID=2528007 RepID=A0A518CP12_9PLAN|nr:zinc ribbon domain-containing protein [Polystyrenella longa]QDU80966.1 Zinc ribbon domain protein [Polystyrenella longa]